ncbi:hypothetical protein ACFVUH_34900 [Kitasatospora sp. NPDC058032]|uniref:hypothetical protein n=1 Tax=Kitasatospora sp. NPDC058032 TaxID=3346307 RepID=UPI0036D8EA51
MIRQAGTNATALRESVRTACAQPAGHVTGAVAALMGWNLHATAQNYDNTESAIHSQFAQQHG